MKDSIFVTSVAALALLGADASVRAATRFFVEPESCAVDTPVEICVRAALDQPLRPSDTIAFALPESWSSQPYCITFTKEPQLVEPKAPDFVTVEAQGCCFDLSLDRVLLPSGSKKGHVRKVVATLRKGTVQAGDSVVLQMRNFTPAWLADACNFVNNRLAINILQVDFELLFTRAVFLLRKVPDETFFFQNLSDGLSLQREGRKNKRLGNKHTVPDNGQKITNRIDRHTTSSNLLLLTS